MHIPNLVTPPPPREQSSLEKAGRVQLRIFASLLVACVFAAVSTEFHQIIASLPDVGTFADCYWENGDPLGTRGPLTVIDCKSVPDE